MESGIKAGQGNGSKRNTLARTAARSPGPDLNPVVEYDNW